ncbi:BnaA06g02560D [Brassica napus]|uniref:Lon protease homolog n=1 Tax=Brassica napus TaxID=3708 RepID=A0A078GBR2_BRANA|nr:BnaA06g02560D [Brassica napus]
MLKLFTSHHVASRFKNRSAHKLARRGFFSTLTDSKPTNTVSAKPCIDDCQTVVALPLLRKPLIPGFYMPLYVKDPKVLAALQESKSGRAPYAGAFLLKDDKYASTASSSSSFETVNILDSLKGKESLNKIHQVGTLAQILSIQGEQVILIGRKRLQITEMLSEDPLTVKTHHIKDKPYDKDDEVIIKATYFEVISMLRDVLETTSLWRDQVKTYTQDIGGSNYRKLAETILQKRRRKFTGFGAGIFEAIDVFYQKLTGFGAGVFDANDLNYKKLADFGAGISGANKHKIQEVLEELDVHKRLVLVKKQVEVDKIQVFHASIFPESTAKTVEDKQEESGSANYVEKTQPSDKFRERVYSKLILEEIPKHVVKVMEEKFEKLDRGEKDSRSTESIYNYLDWLTALPWGECSDDSFDVLRAEKILDEDHYGLRDVKERILEFIAVGTLTSNPQGRIICLSGPPGVGKTSIARSVARALNRKFFRIAVGGLSDSAEIKGERGIYIGAAPGKMVQCLKEVGTENPLVLLDEIDKLGKSSRDDPEGALLELLDPQQNTHFLDYFLDVTIDLSKVLFVCTANDTDKISGPLLDRMEVIELAGYTTDEKMHIARDYLLKNVKRKCGLKPEQVDVSDTALLSLIENYCREAGVRNIQKHIEKIFRKIALKLVRQQASALAAMTDLKSSETDAKGSIELTNEYLRLADVLKVFEYAVGGGPTREKSREIALKLGRQQASTKAAKTDLKSYNEYLRLMELEYALAGGPMSDKSRAVPEFTIDASNLADYVGKPVFRGEKIYEQTPVGVVMGLAWTSMGGSTLYIETTFVEEGEGKGGLHITGHLGKVMKESAEIAHTVARRIMFDKDPGNLFFANSKLHLHVPEGATPKDGPSAGCTMITSLLSLAMKKPVRKDLAMTGEVTLTGRILPIGGLKEKTMAARRSQVKVIIFPEANRRDFEGLEESVKEGLDVHFVDEYEQIFELAFGHDH